MQREEELQRLKQSYDIFFMKSPINYAVLNSEYRIVDFNMAFEATFGVERNCEHIFTNFVEFDDQSNIRQFFEEVQAQMRPQEILVKMTDGMHAYDIKIICRPVLDREEMTYYCALIDVTNELSTIQTVDFLSVHDQLTGLYNRQYFEEKLSLLKRNRTLPIAMIMGDVLALKKINGNHGFDTGNQVLYAIGVLLKEKVRGDDIVARVGEDAFAVLLASTTEEEVKALVHRLELCFEDLVVRGIHVDVIWAYNVMSDAQDSLLDFVQCTEIAVMNKKSSIKKGDHHDNTRNGV